MSRRTPLVLAGLLLALPAGGADPDPKPAPAANPLKLIIELDKKEYPFRGVIALTLTYENTSKDAVALWANGQPAGEGQRRAM